MHKLETHILHRLTLAQQLRYSQIKPPSIEGNHFMYYLKKLIGAGLVSKTQDHYQLTTKGRSYVDKLSLSDFQPRIQPKIVTLIACQNSQGDYLLYRRSREPFLGLIGFPYGKIHLGETILQAATRELAEKTGIAAKLHHVGNVYLTIHDSKELITHMLCHIFTGQRPTGELIAKSKIGDCFWGSLTDFKLTECIPGNREILKLINQKSPAHFFAEYSFDLKSQATN